ncbi:MAG TPA: RnfH family protein [Xanthomonadaceae bacterium]
MRVEVVYALPERAWSVLLDLPAGATAADALARSAFANRIPGFDQACVTCAIYGKAITLATLLREGDRLELLRPLKADPKQARRQRARDRS